MRALIADDEPLARAQLRRLLAAESDVEIACECDDGDQTVAAIRQAHYDVVFLDIQMPKRDGFGVLTAVGPERMPPVVFATAYDEYAIQALRKSAVDYLLKPVDPSELAHAVARVRRRLSTPSESALGDSLRRLLAVGAPQYVTRLVLKDDGRFVVVPVAGVDRIVANGNYAIAHAGNKTHVVRLTLNELTRQLDPGQFARIHRSAIVNLGMVREVQPWFRGEFVAILTTGAKLRVGATYRDDFFQRLASGRPERATYT